MRRKALLARGHQMSGQHPFRQRDMRAFHDGPDRHANRSLVVEL
jgi:hypothetical protein